MTHHNQYGDILCLVSVGLGHNSRPLGGILYMYETLEWLCILEDVTRASTDIVVSSKWVIF